MEKKKERNWKKREKEKTGERKKKWKKRETKKENEISLSHYCPNESEVVTIDTCYRRQRIRRFLVTRHLVFLESLSDTTAVWPLLRKDRTDEGICMS